MDEHTAGAQIDPAGFGGGAMKPGAWLAIGAVGALGVFYSLDTPKHPAPTPPAGLETATEFPTSTAPTPYVPAPSPLYSEPTFHGYDCSTDCSGHEAGYAWAEEHSVTDPDECGGNSDSFIEGCQAYEKEQNGDEETEDNESENEDE